MPSFTVYLLKDVYNFDERYSETNGNVTENNFSVFNDGVIINSNIYIEAYIAKQKIDTRKINKSLSTELIYYRNTDNSNPWWRDFWGIPENLTNQSTDVIVLQNIGTKKVVITHGHGRFLINPLAIEYDFGLRTALNLLDEDKVKSADLFTPSEIALRTRKQSGVTTKIEEYDINIYNTLLKNISGKVVKEYEDYFKTIDGADSIHFSFSGPRDKFIELVKDLIFKYSLKLYMNKGFSWIDNFRIVKDKGLINELNGYLLLELNKRNTDIIISFPEIVDKNIPLYYRYAGISNLKNNDLRYPELDIVGQYYTFLDDLRIVITEDDIKKHKIVAFDMNNQKDYNIQKLYTCLYYDFIHNGIHYFLENGTWYNVDDKFIKTIDDTYLKIMVSSRSINVKYDKAKISSMAVKRKVSKEYIFNEMLTTYMSSIEQSELLDTKLITKIEVCDVISSDKMGFVLFHNKYKYGSSALSHLFSQGYVSAVSLTDSDFRKKTNKIVGNKALKFDETDLYERKKYTIIYGIIAKKNKKGEFDLPLFSKINLNMFYKNITTLGYKIELVYFEQI
jgi:uncharacterized protein (TIGR04141 family)